jgi:hypothetical protein
MAVLVIFRTNGDPADLLSRYERTLAVPRLVTRSQPE